MEIKHLKSFIAVATYSNFSRAANALNTVQPAISKHIAMLEDELGTQLFFRTSREVSLTAAGERLYREANLVLKQIEDTKKAVIRSAQGQIGTLTIGYLGGAVLSFLPCLVRQYRKRQPNVEINLVEMTVSEQILALEEKRIDLSFSRPLPEQYQEKFKSHYLYHDQLVAVVCREHPLAKHSAIHLNQLAGEPFILFERDSAVALYDLIIKECQVAGFSPNLSNTPKHMLSVLLHVASGLGVSVAPASIKDFKQEECVFIPLKGLTPNLALVMSYHAYDVSPTTHDFIQLSLEQQSWIKEVTQL